MSDIAHTYNPELLAADMSLIGIDLATEEGLYTAVVISLFTDARADKDDELPAGENDSRRGWWGGRG